jgi:hypothetical protein
MICASRPLWNFHFKDVTLVAVQNRLLVLPMAFPAGKLADMRLVRVRSALQMLRFLSGNVVAGRGLFCTGRGGGLGRLMAGIAFHAARGMFLQTGYLRNFGRIGFWFFHLGGARRIYGWSILFRELVGCPDIERNYKKDPDQKQNPSHHPAIHQSLPFAGGSSFRLSGKILKYRHDAADQLKRQDHSIEKHRNIAV